MKNIDWSRAILWIIIFSTLGLFWYGIFTTPMFISIFGYGIATMWLVMLVVRRKEIFK